MSGQSILIIRGGGSGSVDCSILQNADKPIGQRGPSIWLHTYWIPTLSEVPAGIKPGDFRKQAHIKGESEARKRALEKYPHIKIDN